MSRAPHEQRLLEAFRRVAADRAWYRTLLDAQGVTVSDIVDAASFASRCPVLGRHNTFDRFTLAELCAPHPVAQLASVLTSSGHGGRFSFGLATRAQEEASADRIDDVLDAAFGVRSRATLAINCLPMGVGFSSRCMTMATTSVREDMALALVESFGASFEQVLIAADPLFLKRLVDHAAERNFDWTRHCVHVVLGEETFGEHFRGYISTILGHDLERPAGGYVMSSFGVGELGLNLCHETPATIALRRAAQRNPALGVELLGRGRTGLATPMVFSFEPMRTWAEVVEPDANGYGPIAFSKLEEDLPVPLLRYTTGDIGRVIDPDAAAVALRRHGVRLPGELPPHLIAIVGRDREVLPNGVGVSVYKDALYADHGVARHVTGACRMVFTGEVSTMHVQLLSTTTAGDSLAAQLLDVIPADARPARVRLWPRHRFPFGQTLDYERKFRHFVPGEGEPAD